MSRETGPKTSEVDAKPGSPKPARPAPVPGETPGTSAVEGQPDRPKKPDAPKAR